MILSVAWIVSAYMHTIYKFVIKIYTKPMLLNIGAGKCFCIKSFFWIYFNHEINFNGDYQGKVLSGNKPAHNPIKNNFSRLKFNISQHTKIAN